MMMETRVTAKKATSSTSLLLRTTGPHTRSIQRQYSSILSPVKLLGCTLIILICNIGHHSHHHGVEGLSMSQSTFAFLNVRGSGTPAGGHRYCVNYQNLHSLELPTSEEKANPLKVAWWSGERGYSTNVCQVPSPSARPVGPQDIVPLDYHPGDASPCAGRGFNISDRRNIINNELRLAERERKVRSVLFLVDKGSINVVGIRDYLWSQFFNPTINGSEISTNLLYIYRNQFHRELKPALLRDPSSQLRLYRPAPWLPVDASVLCIWLLAIGSVAIGGLWAAHDARQHSSTSTTAHLHEISTTQQGESSTATLTAATGSSSSGGGGAEARPQNSNESSTPAGAAVTATTPTPAALSSQERKRERQRKRDQAQANMTTRDHCVVVGVLVVLLVVILLLSFYFRPAAVWFFNVFILLAGPPCLKQCLYAALMLLIEKCCGGRDPQMLSIGQILCCCCSYRRATDIPAATPDAETGGVNGTDATRPGGRTVGWFHRLVNHRFFTTPLRLYSTATTVISYAVGTLWFVYRRNYYAFLALDTLNAALCICSIRASNVRSLRLVAILLSALFFYDLFMVFGTTLLSPSGCSVMIEVVTGVDCANAAARHTNGDHYPQAPIDQNYPENIPILFSVPPLSDPMEACYDLEVEGKARRGTMLGLGDVILPGYLIAFCFYADVMTMAWGLNSSRGSRSRYAYGIVSLAGYTIGMLATFAALYLMRIGQPALIYLVPCTLLPVSALALWRAEFTKLWKGRLKEEGANGGGDEMVDETQTLQVGGERPQQEV